MFSGFQELLVIAAIFIVLVFLSRFKRQEGHAAPSRRPKPGFSGILRAAVSLSLAWAAGTAIYLWPWEKGLRPFVLVGVVPVAAVWSIAWVVAGFRQNSK